MGQQQGYASARMDYHDQASFAMNYYEELGVSQEATGEEIRKAHRRLVKLMHPDAQLDLSLKGLAETQMRRLNSIVSTLLDADQRRAYDDQLRNEMSSVPMGQDRGGHWRGLPWWLLSAAGAVVLTLFAIWLWADHLSNNFGKGNHTIYVRPVENPPVASAEKPVIPDPTPTAKVEEAHNDFPPAPADLSSSHDGYDSSSGVSASVVPPDASQESARPQAGSSANTKVASPTLTLPVPVPQTKPKPETSLKTAVSAPPVPVPVVKSERHDVAPSASRSQTKAAPPVVVTAPKPSPEVVAEKPKKIFNLPASTVVANANAKPVRTGTPLLPPPSGLTPSPVRDETAMAVGAPLPTVGPRPDPLTVIPSRSGASLRPRDPLEGEWVYAPKEPERRKPGFYPPEFIDLKLFSNNDSGSLHGQYSARYVIADKPIPPEVSFQLASASTEKDLRKFTWQGTDGSKGTVAIHPVDDNTIRIEWRTTSAVRGPALTSGAATLVRRQ